MPRSYVTPATIASTGSTLYVDATNGAVNGSRGRPDKQFLLPSAAQAAASAGDLIIVFPGTYVEQIELTKNLKWHFHAGARVAPIAVGSNALNNLSAPVTVQITGRGEFVGANIGLQSIQTSNISIQCKTLNGAVVNGNGTYVFDLEDAGFTLGSDTAGICTFYIRSATSLQQISLKGANIKVFSYGRVNSTAIGLIAFAGAKIWHYGDVYAASDGIDARDPNSRIEVFGDCIAYDDAGLFVDTGGTCIVHGDCRNVSTTGMWQMAGNGCGVFNGTGATGGTAIVYGDVSGIQPVICGNGTTRILGKITTSNNGQTLLYREYFLEPLYGISPGDTIWQPAGLPAHLSTGANIWVNNAITILGTGTVEISADASSALNHAARIGNGTLRIRAGAKLTSTFATGNAAYMTAGTLELEPGVQLRSGASATNSVHATAAVAITAYGDFFADKDLHANAVIGAGGRYCKTGAETYGQILPAGADANYSLTAAYALLTTAQLAYTAALPAAGVYLVEADLAIQGFTVAGDFVAFKFRNSTLGSDVAVPATAVTPPINSAATVKMAALITVAAANTIQIHGFNSTAARGEVVMGRGAMRWRKLK